MKEDSLSASKEQIKIWTIPLFTCQKTTQKASRIRSNDKAFREKGQQFVFDLQPYAITMQLQSYFLLTLFFRNTALQQQHFVAISNESIPYPLSKYFPKVSQIYSFFCTNSNCFVMNDSGEVECYLSTETCKQLKQKFAKKSAQNSIVNKELPYNCIGNVMSLGRTFRGALVGSNLVLTSAEALYDHQTKARALEVQFVLSPDFSSKNFFFCYPIQFQTSSDQQKSTFNYGLIILEQNVDLINTLTLLYDYHEAIIAKKIQQLEYDMRFDYYIGTDKLSASQFNLFSQKKKVPQGSLSIGDPILIKFSNGRVGVIGIVAGESQSFMFTEQFRSNLYRWLMDMKYYEMGNVDKNIAQLSLRVFHTKQFDFTFEQIPLTNGEIRPDQNLLVKLNQSLPSDDRKCMATAALWQSLGIHSLSTDKDPTFKKTINKLKKCINLYKRLFGKYNWKTSRLSYLIALIYKKEMPNEAVKFYQIVVQLQQYYQWNPLILGKSYLQIAMKEKSDKCIQYYKKAIVLGTNYHDYKNVGNSYHGLGNKLFSVKKYEEGGQHFKKGIQMKRKHGTTNELLKILMGYIKQCFRIKRWRESLKYFHEMLMEKNKIQSTDQQINVFINDYWSRFINTFIREQTLSSETFEIMTEIVLNVYPQNKELLEMLKAKVKE